MGEQTGKSLVEERASCLHWAARCANAPLYIQVFKLKQVLRPSSLTQAFQSSWHVGTGYCCGMMVPQSRLATMSVHSVLLAGNRYVQLSSTTWSHGKALPGGA